MYLNMSPKLIEPKVLMHIEQFGIKETQPRWSYCQYLNALKGPQVKAVISDDENAFVIYLSYSKLKQAHVLQWAVKEKGKGLGLKFFIDFVKSLGDSEIFLELRSDNLAALSIYRKLAFEQLRFKENYYSYPYQADALEMKRAVCN